MQATNNSSACTNQIETLKCNSMKVLLWKNSTPSHGNNEISVIFVSDAFEDGDEVILDDSLSQTRALQKKGD